MGKRNMFENNYLDNLSSELNVAHSTNQVMKDDHREEIKAGGLFSLKNLEVKDRKPTTIIFSKHNYILLKKLSLDANLNMSEFVNRLLERIETDG